jgi:CorA-like Mg2+ transporter protein
MQTLTIVTMIFVPVTFMAGTYGMNLEFMQRGCLMRWTTFTTTITISLALLGMARGAHAFPDHAFVVTGDGGSPGNCATLDLDPPWNAITDREPVGARPFARHFLGVHWVVDQSPGGAIQAIDPVTFDTIVQFPVGGSPRDILVSDPGHAWVTRYDSPWLLEVNPATGAPLDSVDLGVFADTDGIPEMVMMARDGDRLFVQIQRVNFIDQPPFLPGLLAVIDLPTRTIVDADPVEPGVQAIALAGYWPDHRMQVESAARRLYVSTPGPRLDVSGGVEEIDLDSLTRLGFLVSEEALSVDVGGFVLVSATRGYYIGHTDIIPSSHLTSFSRPDGTRLTEAYTGILYVNDNVAYDAATGQVFFPDSYQGGIHVFDAFTDAQLTTTAIPTGEAPIDLLVARGSAVDAPVPAAVTAGALSWAVPNPARGLAEIVLARGGGRTEATILDVRGTIVRTLAAPPFRWDGRDARGAPVPAGVYFYRLRGDVTDAGRLVLLR